MTEETLKDEANQEDIELGHNILLWLRTMPRLEDLHKMLISMASVSTTQNGGQVNEAVFNAIAEWAGMLCQNLEMINLFGMQYLIARAGEDGSLEVDFSPEAAAIIEKSQQPNTDKAE